MFIQQLCLMNYDYLVLLKTYPFIHHIIQLLLYGNGSDNQNYGNHELKHNEAAAYNTVFGAQRQPCLLIH